MGEMHHHSAWDPLSRLKASSSLGFRENTSLTPIKKAYAYNQNGDLTLRKDTFIGERSYTYDAVGRITKTVSLQAKREDRSHEVQQALARLHDSESIEKTLFSEESFAYDAASNLMATGTDDWSIAPRDVCTSDFGGKGFSENAKGYIQHNRITELNGFTFTYDDFGRTIEKNHAETKRTWRYTYNAESQLIESTTINRYGFHKTRYQYDLLGRRIAKSSAKSETYFLWSGLQLLSESKGERSNTYIYADGSYAPLARIDDWNEDYFLAQDKAIPNVPHQIYYFHCNVSGMPEEMTDKQGNLIWQARYSTWGKLLFENVTSFAPQGFEQNLRMQGQYHDRETNLYYNTFRYYDTTVGRFIIEDPIGLLGGINLYQYAPNPLSWIDPWGWSTCHDNGRKGEAEAEAALVKNEHTVVARNKAISVRISTGSGSVTIKPDLITVYKNKLFAFEVKTNSGRLTPNQKASGLFDLSNPIDIKAEIIINDSNSVISSFEKVSNIKEWETLLKELKVIDGSTARFGSIKILLSEYIN